MDDPALRQRLAWGARALAQEWFSWDQVVKRTVDTFAPRLLVILFVVDTGHYGGAAKHLLYLARHLSAAGMPCTILCYGSDFYSERLGAESLVRVVRRDRGEAAAASGPTSAPSVRSGRTWSCS